MSVECNTELPFGRADMFRNSDSLSRSGCCISRSTDPRPGEMINLEFEFEIKFGFLLFHVLPGLAGPQTGSMTHVLPRQ